MTAPNGPAQTSLIKATLRNGQINPSRIDIVSVHGTGTPLGDPIEIGALGKGLFDATSRAKPLLVLSNKSCYGHTEGAAGEHAI